MARTSCIPGIAIILCSLSLHAVPTEKRVQILSTSPVTPSTVHTNQLTLKGVYQLNLTVNGTSLGIVRAPYQFTYTSKPFGQVNTFDCTVCYFDGTTQTFNFTAPSGGMTTLRSGGSILPRRR